MNVNITDNQQVLDEQRTNQMALTRFPKSSDIFLDRRSTPQLLQKNISYTQKLAGLSDLSTRSIKQDGSGKANGIEVDATTS